MILYLDTSALLKLYTEEIASAEVREAVAQASTVATSRLSFVEAHAALARKLRAGTLETADHSYLKACLEEDWARYLVVEVSEGLCQGAADLAERHPLRAGDALQLASALTVRQRVQEQIMFSSFDDRLNHAAAGEHMRLL